MIWNESGWIYASFIIGTWHWKVKVIIFYPHKKLRGGDLFYVFVSCLFCCCLEMTGKQWSQDLNPGHGSVI